MRVRLLLIVVATSAALAGCGSAASSDPAAATSAQLKPAAQLKQLRTEAGKFLDGGPKQFAQLVANLRGGYPLVVNQWASWCGPCRFEFPFFADLAKRYHGKLAFVGDLAQDSRQDAQAFLDAHPVPYPHFFDQDASLARSFGGGRSWPTTVFYSRAGKRVFVHQGAYATEKALKADIDRYARG